MDSISQEFVIQDECGLHMRLAALLMRALLPHDAEVRVRHGQLEVNAKSVLSVLTLGAGPGSRLLFSISGPHASAAMRVVATVLAANPAAEKQWLGQAQASV